jgi:hypothetical protein
MQSSLAQRLVSARTTGSRLQARILKPQKRPSPHHGSFISFKIRIEHNRFFVVLFTAFWEAVFFLAGLSVSSHSRIHQNMLVRYWRASNSCEIVTSPQ